MFRRRKQKKDIQLVNVAQRSMDAVIEAGINEKYAPKTSSEMKARRRAVRSMSFQHSFKRREPVEPKQDKAPKKTTQPDLLKGTPRKEMSPQPFTMPDAKLKLVTAPGEDTKNAGVYTSKYSMKIFPAQWGQASQGSQKGKLKYRHSTYVSSTSSFAPPVMKKPSKKSEKESLQEEDDVQVIHFDDTKSPSLPKGRPLSSYDPDARDRTNTATSTFDVTYEL